VSQLVGREKGKLNKVLADSKARQNAEQRLKKNEQWLKEKEEEEKRS